MNRRHLIALAVAFGVPTAVGGAYVINLEDMYRGQLFAERESSWPGGDDFLVMAAPLPQTPDQALPSPEGLDEASPDVPLPTPEPTRPRYANPETGLDLPAPTAAASPSPEDRLRGALDDIRPLELPDRLPTPRSTPEPRQPAPARAPVDVVAPEPTTTIMTPARRAVSVTDGPNVFNVFEEVDGPPTSRTSPTRRTPMPTDSDSGLTPSPFQAPASSSLPSEPAPFLPSPDPEPTAVDERALAEQARSLAEYIVQTQAVPKTPKTPKTPAQTLAEYIEGQPDPQNARTRYHQIMIKNLETLFDRRQQRYNEEVAQLEAKVQSLKTLIEKRQQARTDIVRKRVQQLLNEAEGLGW